MASFTEKYLEALTEEQTLVVMSTSARSFSLSSRSATVIITNGLMVG